MKTSRHIFPSERIVIERRETVAIIEPNEFGTEPMLKIAFERAGDYLANVASPEPGGLIAVEWEYGGAKWGAHVSVPASDGAGDTEATEAI